MDNLSNNKITPEEQERIRREHNKKWYQKTYNSLVEKGKTRGLDKKKLKESGDTTYYEKHHIIPKCMGGTNDKENLVLLTFREHIIAHMLLYEIYEDIKLSIPIYLMMNIESDLKITKYKYSTKQLEYYKIKYIQWKNSTAGKFHTEEHKKELSTNWINNNPMARRVMDKEGNVFNSLTLAAKHYNVSPITLRLWIKNKPEKGFRYLDPLKTKNFKIGEIPESVLQANRKKVVGPDGTIYNSLIDCANSVGHLRGVIRKWIKNKPEKGFRWYVNPEDSNDDIKD